MAHASIVAVGDELVGGHLVDTNSARLASRLRHRGIAVRRVGLVPDDADAIAAAIRAALDDSELVVVSGGLGPTADDLTREGVARALGRPLRPDPGARALLEGFFRERGRELPERDVVQTVLPEGARAIANACGTAPGFLCDARGGTVLVLPGVPAELEAMIDSEPVAACLEDLSDAERRPVVRELTVFGLPESEVGRRLADLMARGRNPRIGSYPRMAWVVLRLEALPAGGERAETLVQRDLAEIRTRLGDHVIGDGAVDPAAVVGRRLLETDTTIAVAESLTGGRVTDLLVGVPGISRVLRGGIVAYANAVKERLLGVRSETLAESGAVSEECAREMAEGVRRALDAAVGVSTTGIAGPTGAVPGKPVGTVWFGLATAAGVTAVRRQMVGDRLQVRERSALFALDLVRRHLA